MTEQPICTCLKGLFVWNSETRQYECSSCHGTMLGDFTQFADEDDEPEPDDLAICPVCHGTGRDWDLPCFECNGLGRLW